MLVPRIITALIFGLLIILAIVYLSPLGINLLALVLVALAVWEFSGLFRNWHYQMRIIYLLLFLAVAILVQSVAALPILIIGVIWWLVAPYLLWHYALTGHNYFTNLIVQGALGLVIFIPCLVGLVTIHGRFGTEFLLYLLAIVWATDIGGYFAGSFWGKHLLVPTISPRKTFEGLCGGVLAALLIAVIGLLLLKFNLVKSSGIRFNFSGLRGVSLVLLTLVTCLWSVIGDLLESMLKRQAGVKDSGNLLPGHGGIYDRIDSLVAALPIFALGLLLI